MSAAARRAPAAASQPTHTSPRPRVRPAAAAQLTCRCAGPQHLAQHHAAARPAPPHRPLQADKQQQQPLPATHGLQQHPQCGGGSSSSAPTAALSSHNRTCGLDSQRRQQRQQQLRLLACQERQQELASEGSKQPPKPQPPAGSGEPPADAAGASSQAGGGSGSSSSSQESSSSSGGSEDGAKQLAPDGAEAAVDRFLEKRWQEIKRDIKKELPPDQAAMVDSWSQDDLSTDKVFREMAQHQLGPFLQVMGIQDDPYAFFLDLFRYALAFQLAGAGVVFYTVELGLGGDAGDGLRAVAGLCIGYVLRLGIKIEQLAWPIYNALVQWLIQDNAVYDFPPASPAEQQDTLNRVAMAVAAAFLVPKLAFGWQNDECVQVALPMVAGLIYFDAAYLLGLLAKLSFRGDDGGDGGAGGDS